MALLRKVFGPRILRVYCRHAEILSATRQISCLARTQGRVPCLTPQRTPTIFRIIQGRSRMGQLFPS